MEFLSYTNLSETLKFLSQHRSICKILSGGTDLLISLRNNDPSIENIQYILSLSNILSLQEISFSDKECIIGGAATFKSIQSEQKLIQNFPLLVDAVSQIGSPQIRNVATIGGNICNLAACADSIAPLLVYDAKVRLVSANDQRLLPLEDILLKPYTVDLKQDEILTEIILSLPKDSSKHCFFKLGRRRGVSISRMSYAILLKTANGKIQDFRIALGSLFPIPRRLKAIEEQVKGKKYSAQLCKDVSREIAHMIVDETGVRWSTNYKIPTIQQHLYTSLVNLT